MEKISGSDLNGNRFTIGDNVLVSKIKDSKIFDKDFVAQASKFRNEGTVILNDINGVTVEVDPKTVEALPKFFS